MSQPLYKLEAPLGSIIVTRRKMTEGQVRYFAIQVNQGDEGLSISFEKGPFEDVLAWLERKGFKVVPI